MNRFCPDFFTFVTIKIKSFVAVGFWPCWENNLVRCPQCRHWWGRGGNWSALGHEGGPAPWYWAEGGAPKMPKGKGFLVLGPPGMSSAAPGVLGGGPNCAQSLLQAVGGAQPYSRG